MDLAASNANDGPRKDTAAEIFGSFFIGPDEFALPIVCIQEVVNPPAAYTPMPLAPAYLLGIFNLRGSVVPVIDLKSVLELDKPAGRDASEGKIVIVDHRGERIGLLFDRTGEIFTHVASQRVGFSYAEGSVLENVVGGAIQLESGARMVQLLNQDALIRLENVPHPRDVSGESSRAAVRQLGRDDRRQCISFYVGSARCAFEIGAILEIVRMPEIQSSAFITELCMGFMTLRSEVIPVIHFARLLGYETAAQAPDAGKDAANDDARRILVMKAGSEKIGLLVDAVEDLVAFRLEEVLRIPVLNQSRAAMFRGCVSQDARGDIILLDHASILSASELEQISASHRKIYGSAGQEKEEQKKRGQRRSYIVFRIGSLFAAELQEVREVISQPEELLTPGSMPEYVRGLLNLRGAIIPIIDTRRLYGMPDAESGQVPCIVIFMKNQVQFGLMVDGVEDILSLYESEMMEVPDVTWREPGQKNPGLEIDRCVEIRIGEQKKNVFLIRLEAIANSIE